jgi:putative ABC transport system substrate-binding protein
MSICLRRRDFIATLGVAAAAWPLAARAQQPSRMRLVGALFFADTLGLAELRQELQRLGWAEGRNLRIDYRFGGSDLGRVTAHAAELVNLGPDVIFVVGGPAVQAVQQRTQTIPIVFVGGGDVSVNNLTGGIARPAGNTTGFANSFNSIVGKYLELLKDAAPRITRVAHLRRDFDTLNSEYEVAAKPGQGTQPRFGRRVASRRAVPRRRSQKPLPL